MTAAPTTAVVVSYRTGPRLRECLYALAYDPDVSAVVIVDNGNDPVDTDWMQDFVSKRDKLTLVSPGANLGFGAGVNLGAQQVPGGDLLIINPDAVLKRGAVAEMRAAAEGRKSPCIIGGKIFGLDGKEARGPRRRKLTLGRALGRAIGMNAWTLEHTPPPDGPVRMDVVSGALMFMSKPDFDRLGGFDEAYFLHVEDIDLCRRAWDTGGEVVYCPDAGALHYGSTSDVPSRTVAKHKADSLVIYFRKFAEGPAERLLVNILAPFLKFATTFRARD